MKRTTPTQSPPNPDQTDPKLGLKNDPAGFSGMIGPSAKFLDEGVNSFVFRLGDKVHKAYPGSDERILARYQELTAAAGLHLSSVGPFELTEIPQGHIKVNFTVNPIETLYFNQELDCWVTTSPLVEGPNVQTLVDPGQVERLQDLHGPDFDPLIDFSECRLIRRRLFDSHSHNYLAWELNDLLETVGRNLRQRAKTPAIELIPYNLSIARKDGTDELTLVITDICRDVQKCAI